MQCKNCQAFQQLLCVKCSNYTNVMQTIRQNQSKLVDLRKKVQQKQHDMKIQQLIPKNQSMGKVLKIQLLKQKILKLKNNIQIERLKKQKIKKINTHLQQKLKIKQSQELRQWLNKLIQTNYTLQTSITIQKKQKLKVIQKLLIIYGMDQKKYKIQKYFTFQQDKNIIFTLDNNQVRGIPVIKANNQQILVYKPLEQKINDVEKYQQEIILLDVIRVSTKLITFTHRLFMNDIKLPFKMYHFKQHFYIGNLLINFHSINQNMDQEFNGQNFKKALNMIQANLEYMAYVIGSPEKPFLLLSKAFLNRINNNQFKYTGFCSYRNGHKQGQGKNKLECNTSNRKWNSFLKYLNPKNIEQHQSQQFFSSTLIMVDQQNISNEQPEDDDEFQILQ